MRVALFAAAACLLAGCANPTPNDGHRRHHAGDWRDHDPYRTSQDHDRYYGHDPRYSNGPNVPQGYMPRPGECRIWYPDRSPNNQPPSGNCAYLRNHVPPGAYLLIG